MMKSIIIIDLLLMTLLECSKNNKVLSNLYIYIFVILDSFIITSFTIRIVQIFNS